MPISPAPDAAADSDVAWLLEDFIVRLMTFTQGESMSHFADMELSMPQLRVLFSLAGNPAAVPISEVAHGVGLSMVTAGRNLDALVKAGLVDRHEDPDDRRVKRVSLNKNGNQILAEHLDCRREKLHTFTDRLSAEERLGLQEALIPILTGTSLSGTNQGIPR